MPIKRSPQVDKQIEQTKQEAEQHLHLYDIPRGTPLSAYYEQDGMKEKLAQSDEAMGLDNSTRKLPGNFAKGSTDFLSSILNETGD